MTFPSSPFPCDVHIAEDNEKIAATHGAHILAAVLGNRFPILRSSPLWRQTWVRDQWFPPLSCVGGPFGMRRRITMPQTRTRRTAAGSYTLRSREYALVRLYSTDNCPSCTAALQAVELMVYSVARFLADEPQWEHRCWFGSCRYAEMPPNIQIQMRAALHRCSCGNRQSLLDLTAWNREADHVVWKWARGSRNALSEVVDGIATARIEGPRVQRIRASRGMLERLYDHFDGASTTGTAITPSQRLHNQQTNVTGYAMTLMGVPVHRDPSLPDEDWVLEYDDGINIRVPVTQPAA